MCGRYNAHNLADLLVTIFGLDEQSVTSLTPRYNIAPGQVAPVVLRHAATTALEQQKWGLVPAWTAGNQAARAQINARRETAASKPAFADAFAQRRCLVPANGYYEWKHRNTAGSKQPWHIHLPGSAAFLMAGIWQPPIQRNRPEQGHTNTFAILTQAPTKEISHIHDRMPVLVAAEDAAEWLAQGTLRTTSGMRLQAEPVSPRLNNVVHDDPSLLDPVVFTPAPAQGTLF